MTGKDLIRYDLLVQDALKGVVRKILSDVAREGLLGEHYFYISFRTDFPGVRLSNRLREKYPRNITIVLQHQFWDLSVTEHGFEVGLSFSGVPERLLVPFDALIGFFDPTVEFGLKFEIRGEEPEGVEETPAAPATGARVTRGAGSEPVEIQPKQSQTPLPERAPAAAEAQPEERPSRADRDTGEKPPIPGATPAAEIVSLDAFRKKS
jgi:hypothetical protein